MSKVIDYPDDVYCEDCGDSVRSHAYGGGGSCNGTGCDTREAGKQCRNKPGDLMESHERVGVERKQREAAALAAVSVCVECGSSNRWRPVFGIEVQNKDGSMMTLRTNMRKSLFVCMICSNTMEFNSKQLKV